MNAVLQMMDRVWAIALNTFREAVRNKVLAILVLFAVALMGFSLVLGQLSLHEEVRIIKDLGLAGISIFGVIIALFLGVNLLSKELDRKTVYAIVPKPLHRWEFLLGKYVGLVVTMTALIVLMSLVLAGFLAMQGGRHGVTMIRAEVLIWLELLLLMAVAMLFSSFSSPWLSAMFAGALWVIGRNTAELEAFAGGKLAGSAGGGVLRVVLELLPDFRMFFVSGANFDEAVVSVHDSFVTWSYVGNAALYAASYSATCLLIAMFLFARRDFT
ncbi:ABC transporter permease [Pseudenhygromyxa sp. WMMC2535]|uniref:ABC transporter permease n=1 Tax=Pseudenhygromyxa sp. WMMC2535 TaxID=2712867 RepID=UPI00155173A3|nr:ABC transporter permease [Pseudenhygromyxa sp. WMMC2535]NVB42857.1 ABC transporter permease [Pseudenhygromyxa sp. WMMC2535]